MEGGDVESEPEKQNDDSPEKNKTLQLDCNVADTSAEEVCSPMIPVSVYQLLDDSGIGSSLTQLKHEAGLETKSNPAKTDDSEAHTELSRQPGEDRRTTNGENNKEQNVINPESFFETPPNSLLSNLPVSVQEIAAEENRKSQTHCVRETNVSGPGAGVVEEDNASDSTLVTSSSQNGCNDMEDSGRGNAEGSWYKDTCNSTEPLLGSEYRKQGDNRNEELTSILSSCDDERHYPDIPVEQWTPMKSHASKDGANRDKGFERCHNEGGGLPPEDWTPFKTAKQPAVSNEASAVKTVIKNSQVLASRRSSDRKKNTFEEIIQIIEDKIKNLLQASNFCGNETRSELKFIQRQTRYSSDVILNRRISERIVKMGIAHVFLKVWQSVSNVDYLKPENLIVFKNLQPILSIVWNCTDKSAPLCESLVTCGVVQLLTAELTSDKLRDLKDENILYLVKAYLGILHNMARLCSDSRKLFRSCNAVEVLKVYLSCEIGLVKTKAYLILSYIINEEENDIINATHDLLNYIIGILREALSSENHFAKTTCFWACEIADGLNHLAVNDANKVRMGQLGAIQLYLKLLQSDSLEEQSLGTAGIWILAFCDENRHLINNVQGCTQALQILASNSLHEGIRRSAHGALWVIKKTPERPTAQQVKDTDIPHVMISYQWAAQNVMLKVRNRLKAAGYKVWFDVDNMSGSTLEAMALAVERAAVVLICMSQMYKDSASCRTEAEYTYSQRKDIIPLLLQQGYVPDGWLGALVGTRIYVDLTDEETLPNQVERLIKEIGTRGRLNTGKKNLAVPGECERQSTRGDSMCSDLSLSSSTSSLHSYMRLPTALSWSQTEVQQWLTSHHLSHVADRFDGFTGELLLQYKSVMKNAPEYFYTSLETKLKLDLVTTLKFAKALSTLAGTT